MFFEPIENFFAKEVFWSDANDPLLGPKNDFTKFEQCGIGLGMFWWSNGVKLQNLSLIYEMMMICEKKLDTLGTGILPKATTLTWFWPEKAVSSTGT